MKFLFNNKELSTRELKKMYVSLKESQGFDIENVKEDMAMQTPVEFGNYINLCDNNSVRIVKA